MTLLELPLSRRCRLEWWDFSLLRRELVLLAFGEPFRTRSLEERRAGTGVTGLTSTVVAVAGAAALSTLVADEPAFSGAGALAWEVDFSGDLAGDWGGWGGFSSPARNT